MNIKLTQRSFLFFFVLSQILWTGSVRSADWPMWRKDSARSATTAEKLPEKMHRRWTIELPPLRPAYREKRLQFDAGYEPIVLGKQMFVASSRDDSVTAFDTNDGRQIWKFYTDGPIRFAPVAWNDRVCFGSDDGCVYCLNTDDGELVWKYRAVPSQRKVISNGRMISLWPVRGGPVLHNDRLYFAAGVWPFEGVFIYCLNADSGKVIWRNDEASFVYGTQPHNAQSLGGVTPQGYLVVSGDNLIVPCGQAMPATFDLATGKLKSFELPAPGRRPGGWFASAAVRRGEVTLDKEVNQDLHEDKIYQGPGSPGIRTKITVGETAMRFADGFKLNDDVGLQDVEGKEIHSMLAADSQLFVVTRAGHIHCYGDREDPPSRSKRFLGGQTSEKSEAEIRAEKLVEKILKTTKVRDGYALVLGPNDKKDVTRTRHLIKLLLERSNFHLVVVGGNSSSLGDLRSGSGMGRISRLRKQSDQLELPKFFADLIVVASPQPLVDLKTLRPHSGVACMEIPQDWHKKLKEFLSDDNELERSGEMTIIRRVNLKGATNYTGDWTGSPDELVRAPLGVLWFDDTLGHFKRSPQPWFVDGVMISYPKDWMAIHRDNRRPPYDLLPPVYSDIYTGRVIAADEAVLKTVDLPKRDRNEKQPSQYRPPTQKDDWKPGQPVPGRRINPLTGEEEPRSIPKSYGCDGGVDYGHIYTMRSGTPAFYDKRLESGVCSISGPRSGCTNSIIPAGGVLNVPFFYEGCTCSYPLPVGLSLISIPETHEQWSSWGPGKSENIQRVGINFGAPGDRMTRAGTLWLDYPSRGGPSPEISVDVQPKSAKYFYQHSLFVKDGPGWPWVAGSGVEGAEEITIAGLQSATFTVRLTFLNMPSKDARSFEIKVNDQPLQLVSFGESSDKPIHRYTRSIKNVDSKGEIKIELKSKTDTAANTILCGVEIVKNGLPLK